MWVVVGWMVCRRVGSADRACTRRETQGEDWAFARCARGGGVRFQCSFRLDPLTLGGSWVGGAAGAGDEEGEVALGCCGLDGVSVGELCGSSLHSQGSSGEDRAFALCARGGVRFQCSFRHDPLTLGGSSLICSGLTDKQCRRRLRGTCGSDRCDAELCR